MQHQGGTSYVRLRYHGPYRPTHASVPFNTGPNLPRGEIIMTSFFSDLRFRLGLDGMTGLDVATASMVGIVCGGFTTLAYFFHDVLWPM
jgi:hypothetical protein